MTAQGDRTRKQLIEATATLVAEVGYHQATTRAIAKRAGVAEGTLYRHYPDKRSLFFAAVLTEHQPVLDAMAGLPARAGTAPLADLLTDALAQLWQLRRTVLPLELALATDPDQPRSTGGADLEALAAAGGPPLLLAQYLAVEQRQGRVRRELDPQQVAVVLLATLFGLALNPSTAPGATEPSAADRSMLRGAVTLILAGVATAARPPEPEHR